MPPSEATLRSLSRVPSPWPRSGWLPLLIVVANFSFLIAWPKIEQFLLGNLPALWSWRNALHDSFRGWVLGYVPLVSIWLVFGQSRAWVRWPAIAATIVVATFLLTVDVWGAVHDFSFLRPYHLADWRAATVIAAQWLAGLHLVLFPFRVLLNWRLDFAAARQPAHRRPFQFSMRDLFLVTIATAAALAIIRGCQASSASATSYLLRMPMPLWLLWLGQILIPALACIWLAFAVERRWVGGLVLALSLACPLLLLAAGWHVPLKMASSGLLAAHWMNVGVTACVAVNVLALRLGGLRLVITSPNDHRDAPAAPSSLAPGRR